MMIAPNKLPKALPSPLPVAREISKPIIPASKPLMTAQIIAKSKGFRKSPSSADASEEAYRVEEDLAYGLNEAWHKLV